MKSLSGNLLQRGFLYKPCFVVSLFTTIIFIARLHHIDLPVWDDANTYHFGWRILSREWYNLNIQWSPPLVLLCAILNLLLHSVPITGFFVFQAIGHVTLALGTVSILASIGCSSRSAALLTALWCLLCHSVMEIYYFPTLHLYHAGVPLLVGSYYLRRSPVSLPAAVGFLACSFLVRNESVIFLLPLLVAGALRRKSASGRVWNTSLQPAVFPWFLVLLLLVIMGLDPDNFRLGRMNHAFAQHFHWYTIATEEYTPYISPEADIERKTLDNVFEQGASERGLLALFLRNPEAFAKFMKYNIDLIFRGLLVPGNHTLSHMVMVAFFTGICFLLIMSVCDRNPILLCTAISLVSKIPMLLLIAPRFHYISDVLMLGIIGSWPLCFRKKGIIVSYALIISANVVSVPFLCKSFSDNGKDRLNLQRAFFIRDIGRDIDLSQAVLAEYFSPFSQTFGSRELKQSIPFFRLHIIDGELTQEDGDACDLVLMEEDVSFPKDLASWVVMNEPLVVRGPFRLYKGVEGKYRSVSFGSRAGKRTVTVTDDSVSRDDLSWRRDYDSRKGRALVIRWNLEDQEIDRADITDFHVYVQEDCSVLSKYLGRTGNGSARFFEWKERGRMVSAKFREGPRFGRCYQFSTYAIAGEKRRAVFGPFRNSGPVELLSLITVTDDMSSLFDISDGEDVDPAESRELVVRWMFDAQDVDLSDVKDFHVYVRTDKKGSYEYLGRTGNGNARCFEWKSGRKLRRGRYRDGPEFGHRYEFRVHVLTKSGKPRVFGPFENAGPVKYNEAAR